MGAWDWIKDHIDPGNLLHQNNVPNQPGVTANGVSSFTDLQRDPITGMYFDPTTGNTFTDPYGQKQVMNPNVAQQVAANFQQANSLLAGVQDARKTAATANAGQGRLVQDLNGVISGSTPSVAGTQLAGTLGGIQRTQSAMASGYGGANAFAARQAAARNTGNAQISAAQAAASLRAQEIASAIGAKGGVLNSMATNANTQASQDLAGGTELAGLSMRGQTAQQGLDASANKDNTEESNDKAQRTVGAVGSLWGMGGGGKK